VKRSPLTRRTRIKGTSEKRQGYEAELAEITPAVVARARHRCEAKLDGCQVRPEQTPHHRKRRSQGGPNTMANLLAVCRSCHFTIHALPQRSYELGLLIRRADEITPYQGRESWT
jgi:hypothetical protein